MSHKNELTLRNPGRMLCMITTHIYLKFLPNWGIQVPCHLHFLVVDSARFCGVGFHSMWAWAWWCHPEISRLLLKRTSFCTSPRECRRAAVLSTLIMAQSREWGHSESGAWSGRGVKEYPNNGMHPWCPSLPLLMSRYLVSCQESACRHGLEAVTPDTHCFLNIKIQVENERL